MRTLNQLYRILLKSYNKKGICGNINYLYTKREISINENLALSRHFKKQKQLHREFMESPYWIGGELWWVVSEEGNIQRKLFIEKMVKITEPTKLSKLISNGWSFNFSNKSGFIFRPKSFWMGLHYSDYNDRYCLNILPALTIWWIGKNGKQPEKTL